MEKRISIVFVSNYFTHHQKPFSDAIYEKSGIDYLFIETEVMEEERQNMGWSINEIPSYVITSRTFYENNQKFLEKIEEADVVVFGSAPQALIKSRIQNKKLVIRYSERPIKDKYQKWKYLYRLYSWRKLNPQYDNMIMLCASAYTSADYAKHYLYKNKCYRWGYFPKTEKYDSDALVKAKDKKSILWCGRFLDWKHPETAVEIAKRLRDEGYEFTLNFIGSGEIYRTIENLIDVYNLQDYVQLLGNMSPEMVRKYMEQAGVYLFTSDFREGWGAVLNEAMNSGCAVVASHAIGSVPFLVKHNENGFIYKNGDIDDLYNKVKYLLDNPQEQERLGKNAYSSIVDLWNAEIAADRFVKFVEQLKENKTCNIYSDGPCSMAENLPNNWFNGS